MSVEVREDRQAAIRALIEKWRTKAEHFDAEAHERRVGITDPIEWEASRLRDCADELEDLLRALPPEGVIPQTDEELDPRQSPSEKAASDRISAKAEG